MAMYIYIRSMYTSSEQENRAIYTENVNKIKYGEGSIKRVIPTVCICMLYNVFAELQYEVLLFTRMHSNARGPPTRLEMFSFFQMGFLHKQPLAKHGMAATLALLRPSGVLADKVRQRKQYSGVSTLITNAGVVRASNAGDVL